VSALSVHLAQEYIHSGGQQTDGDVMSTSQHNTPLKSDSTDEIVLAMLSVTDYAAVFTSMPVLAKRRAISLPAMRFINFVRLYCHQSLSG
jgi:hypothetical protein